MRYRMFKWTKAIYSIHRKETTGLYSSHPVLYARKVFSINIGYRFSLYNTSGESGILNCILFIGRSCSLVACFSFITNKNSIFCRKSFYDLRITQYMYFNRCSYITELIWFPAYFHYEDSVWNWYVLLNLYPWLYLFL